MKEYDSKKWALIAYDCVFVEDIEDILDKNSIIGKTIKTYILWTGPGIMAVMT